MQTGRLENNLENNVMVKLRTSATLRGKFMTGSGRMDVASRPTSRYDGHAYPLNSARVEA